MRADSAAEGDAFAEAVELSIAEQKTRASSEGEICAGCCLPLTERGVRGECLRCALRMVLGGDEDEDQDANGKEASASEDAAANVRRYGHFEVARGYDGSLAELGSGAMATTYRALDTILRLPVALKVINQSVGGHPDARARFLREARAAARLQHPNVASVTFYGEERGECFYAMELVEGETLAERVRRTGPFTPEQALEVGVQVARALAAAEAVGVVHRDLKPSNLMLAGAVPDQNASTAATPGPEQPLHVKVIDWGLAKAVSATADPLLGADHTRGGFVGTPAFASPEQFGGQTGREQRIDTRSDIYSLGVTLWYLLCGKVPFVGDTLESIHERQRKLPLEQLRVARVPSRLADVLRRMVAFDPAARPQSARELLEVLRDCQERCTGGAVEKAQRRHHRTLAVALSLLFVLVVGTATWEWQRTRNPVRVPEQKPSLAVLPFANLSDDHNNAYFTEGMQGAIVTRLAKLASLKVTSGSSTQGYQAQPTNLVQTAEQLGVAYLLEGNVQKVGNTVRVNVQLIRAATAEHVWAESYDRPLDDLFTVESEVAQAVAERLHARLSGQEKVALTTKRTQNPAAYDQYLRGLAFILRPYTSLNDSQEAVKAFQEAVRLDPGFALGWAWLARAASFTYLRQYYDPGSSMPAIAREASRRALGLQPDLQEAVLAQGDVLYYCERDYPGAAARFEQALRLSPNDSDALTAHGKVSRRLGRWQQSLEDFSQALAINPRDPSLVLIIAETYADLRRFDEALKYYALGHDLAPGGDEAWFQIADIHLARGELPEAAASLARARPDPKDGPPEKQLELWVYERRFDAGIAVLKNFLALPDIAPDDLLWARSRLAWFEEYAGQADAARQDWTEIRAALEPSYHEDTRDSLRFAWLAFARAALGDREGAVALARTLYRNVASGGNLIEAPGVEEILARVLVRTGQLDEAADILKTLLGKPYIGMLNASHPITRASLRLDPEWDPLRKEQRFAKLFSDPEVPTTLK